MLNFGNEDFLPALEIAKLQHRRWESQRHYVTGNSGFLSAPLGWSSSS